MPKLKNKDKQYQQQQLKQEERRKERMIKQSHKKKRNQARCLKGYEKHFKEFSDELNQLGLYIRDVDGDGNCLFRSIADVHRGDERKHKDYRKLAVQALEKQRELFQFFIEDDMTYDQYLKAMLQDGEWGGHLELQALAAELDVNFIIHMKGRPAMVMTYMDYVGSKKDILLQKENIHLAYHLVENVAEHYSAVRMLGDDAHEKAQPIPMDIFDGMIDDMQEYQEADIYADLGIDMDGAQFENEEEAEFMRQYVESLKQQEEEARNLEKFEQEQQQFQQQQPQENYKLKQTKNSKCKCGSKKTYKDCCMVFDQKKDTNKKQQQQQQPQPQPQANKPDSEGACKKSIVFI